MPDISISIVSYNQLGDLRRLLPSLIPAARYAKAEILLVDNYGQDGIPAYVAANFPEIHLILNRERAGYGQNHNLNLARARGQYFVVMNADMQVLQEAMFATLRSYMEQHDQIGILTGKVINDDGTIQGLNKRYPTVLDLTLRRAVPTALQPWVRRRLDYYEMRDIGYDRPCDVEFISGAFMFCRTGLVRSLGGFDPHYFLYFEDVDLCRRVQRTHRTAYYPGVAIVHFWQRATRADWRYTWYFVQSALRYFRTWGVKIA